MEFVMSSLDLERSIAAQKATLEAMFGILSKALECIDKLASLNLRAFKTILAENQEVAVRGVISQKPAEVAFATGATCGRKSAVVLAARV
jgi:hypothetical protein